ncbi:MAG: hypothetical protein NDI82_02700 [Anaeromyxobacteraceae bacterium]|nr:hypothetical protein [Anaeromyxobacteraceae bacterium]
MRAALLPLFALAACAAPPEAEPLHHAVVCTAADEASCPAAERSAEFDRWTKAALRRPGSTFSVWRVGGPRGAVFVACVPERWGNNVMGAKAAFLKEGRARAGEGGAALPPGCTPSDEAAARAVVLSAAGRQVLEAPPEPHHAAVVCDRSDSMLGLSCDGKALEAAYDRWLERSGAATGSTFAVYGVGTGRDTASVLFRVAASSRTPGERLVALLEARARVAAGLGSAPAGSALVEALDVAAGDLKARQGTKSVLLLSDLRQVTPGTWNFEVAAPEPAAFAAWLRSSRLLPPLRGVELQACGLHHRRAPGAKHYDAALARRVEQAWAGALREAGAGGAAIGAICPADAGHGEGS